MTVGCGRRQWSLTGAHAQSGPPNPTVPVCIVDHSDRGPVLRETVYLTHTGVKSRRHGTRRGDRSVILLAGFRTVTEDRPSLGTLVCGTVESLRYTDRYGLVCSTPLLARRHGTWNSLGTVGFEVQCAHARPPGAIAADYSPGGGGGGTRVYHGRVGSAGLCDLKILHPWRRLKNGVKILQLPPNARKGGVNILHQWKVCKKRGSKIHNSKKI